MSESLAEHILNISRKQADKTAFIYYENGNKRTLSYANFRRLIAAFSLAIKAKKIPPHSLVFLIGENLQNGRQPIWAPILAVILSFTGA